MEQQQPEINPKIRRTLYPRKKNLIKKSMQIALPQALSRLERYSQSKRMYPSQHYRSRHDHVASYGFERSCRHVPSFTQGTCEKTSKEELDLALTIPTFIRSSWMYALDLCICEKENRIRQIPKDSACAHNPYPSSRLLRITAQPRCEASPFRTNPIQFLSRK